MDNFPWVTLVTGLVAGLGIGSVATALIQYGLRQREAVQQSQRRDLEARYGVVILLMYAAYDFAGNDTALRIPRADLTSRQAVLDELQAEWINMLLFASRTTLDALRIFIKDPSASKLALCATSMRSDLGRDPLPARGMEWLTDR